MAQERSHARWREQEARGGSTNTGEHARLPAAGTSRRGAVSSYDTEELAAGCALSEGFRLLHHQLSGLPTTLRALREWAGRDKLSAIVLPTAAGRVATVMRKLAVVPSLLHEWRASPSLPTASLLCAQARQLLTDVPFTRQFLRAQSKEFHDAVAAGTTELPAELCTATQRAIHAAEEQIRTSSHHLVVQHLYMAQLIAQEYQTLGVAADDLSDLMQDGCLGLLAAAELFDVRAGARFRTYAAFWLRQAVTRSLRTRRVVVPPRARQRAARQLARRAAQLEQLFARAITPEELSAATGVMPQEIHEAFATQLRDVSLDAPLSEGLTLGDLLVAPGQEIDDDTVFIESESVNFTQSAHGRLRRRE